MLNNAVKGKPLYRKYILTCSILSLSFILIKGSFSQYSQLLVSIILEIFPNCIFLLFKVGRCRLKMVLEGTMVTISKFHQREDSLQTVLYYILYTPSKCIVIINKSCILEVMPFFYQ